MKHIIKKIIGKRLLAKYCKWQYLNIKTLVRGYNQLQSMKQWRACDRDNNPIAWYTYPTLEYLNALDFSSKIVLEWGGVAPRFIGLQEQKRYLLLKAIESGMKR